jgi:hypothetical protein
MPIAADYPFLDIFWTMVLFFAWIVYIWMMVIILTDVFRRQDIGGWTKAGWVVFLIVLPFVGALAYLIAQHEGMAARNLRDRQASKAEFDTYVRSVAASEGPATEIEKAERLLQNGTITQDEFEAIKAKALAPA